MFLEEILRLSLFVFDDFNQFGKVRVVFFELFDEDPFVVLVIMGQVQNYFLVLFDKVIDNVFFHILDGLLCGLFRFHDCGGCVVDCAGSVLIQKMVVSLFRDFDSLDGVRVNTVFELLHGG